MTRKEKLKASILEKLEEIERLLIETPEEMENEEYQQLLQEAKDYRELIDYLESL